MAVIVHCASCGAALPSGGGQCPECLLLLGLRDGQPGENGSADLPSHSALRSFGDYELIEEIARGGMGVVFKARQVSLNRIVAVKMILAGHFAGPASVRRFRTEAEATAKLRHPNIVAIHEVAEHDGQLFFSMDYIEGQNLVAVVREKSMAVRRAAALLRTVAEAIHYAHGQGLVHRDLKPSNILLDADGQPHVTDFGLAKQMFATDVRRFTAPGSEATVTKGESEKAGEVGSASKSPSLPPAYLSSTENQSLLTAELTLTGQVLGSPNYISPEQATGKRGTTGPASDVYALGAVLCHLLTGRAPFVGETLTDILDQVLHKEPASPRLLNPAVPRDLETICLKCLEKDPARRYATAQELAEELGRFLRDEPIRACPASQWEKAWRWCRRKPLVAGLAAGVLLLLLAVAVGSPLAAYHIQRQRERADAEAAHARASEQQAQANLAQAETNLWASYLAQAQARRWSRRPGQRFESLDALKKAAAIRPSIELRNEAVACLALRDLRVTKEWDVEPREGSNVGPNFSYEQVDQTGERLVWVGTNGIVRVQRIADGHELLALPGFPRSNVLPSFDPTGRLLLVGSIFFDGEKPNKTKTHFKVFDLANGHAICSNTVPRAYIWFISPDSRMLVVLHLPSSGTNFVGIYDLGRGEQLERIDVHGTPWSASLHPYKDILAIGFLDGQIEIWDWRKKERRHTLKCPAAVNSMDWHPSSELLVAGCQDFRTYLIDPERERIVTVASDHGSVVPGVRFNHAGDLLASWAWDGTIRLWNPNTGQPVLRTEGGAPMSGFSLDDRWIGCVTGNSRCGLMEVSPAREFRQWQFRAEDKSGSDYVEWSPDGRWLLAANYYGKVHLWDAASGKEVAALPCETPAARFHPTRESLLVSTVNGLKLWPMTLHTEGSDTRLVLGPPEDLLPDVGADFATFDPSGQTLVLNGDGQTYKKHKETFIRFFDLLTRREVRRLSMDPEAYGFTLSRDCRWCAGWAYFSRDLVRVWDVASGQVVRDLMVSYAEGTAFSPDGHILLSQEGQECVAWETGKWRRLYSFPHSSGPQDNLAATFASDGRLAAVRHHVNAALLFDPLTGRELATLEPPEAQMILGLAFSPDGTRLAAATSGKFIQIWDLRALREQLAAIKLDWELPPYPPAPSKTATGSIQVTLLEGTNSLPVQPSSKK